MTVEQVDERKKSFFYGWVVAIVSAVIYGAANAGTFCLGIFIKPMSQDFGWGRADVVLAVGIFTVVCVGLAVVTGRICDKHGPKPLTLVGGISLAVGFFINSRVTELWQFYTGFSICGGIGLACTFVPLTATISRWFVKHRGTALGVMYAGAGVSGLILSPILQSIINSSGWQTAWLVLSILAAVVTIPVTVLVKKDPAVMDLMPLTEEDSSEQGKSQNADMVTASRSYTVKEALM